MKPEKQTAAEVLPDQSERRGDDQCLHSDISKHEAPHRRKGRP